MKNYNHTAAKIYKACKRHARQVKKNLHIFQAEQARPTIGTTDPTEQAAAAEVSPQRRRGAEAAAAQDGKPTQNAQDDGNAPPAAADGLERPSTFYAAAQDGGQGEDTTPSEDPEKELRKSWTAQGVSQERQDEIIAQITAAAQPGAMVGPFRIPTAEEMRKWQEKRAAEAAEDADGRPTIEQLRRQYGGRIEQEFGWNAMQKRARMTRRRTRAMAASELRAEEKRVQEEKKARAEYEAERRAAGYIMAQDGTQDANAARDCLMRAWVAGWLANRGAVGFDFVSSITELQKHTGAPLNACERAIVAAWGEGRKDNTPNDDGKIIACNRLLQTVNKAKSAERKKEAQDGGQGGNARAAADGLERPSTFQAKNAKTDKKEVIRRLREFLPVDQCQLLPRLLHGEEAEGFQELFSQLVKTWISMPTLYATEKAGGKAQALMHYFGGACDWYISEIGEAGDPLRAYGLCDLGHGFPELGYVSIEELIRTRGVELDFHWRPKLIEELMNKNEL